MALADKQTALSGNPAGSSQASGKVDLATVGELRKLIAAPSEWDRLATYVTVVSAGKVNINRAAPEVLAAFYPQKGDTAAGAIIDGRETRPFASFNEMDSELKKSGILTPGEARGWMTTTSDTVTVTVWSLGKIGDHPYRHGRT